MDGVLLINKEKGLTSFDIVEKIKTKFNINKIGHAGTLDPLGKGLLLILINKATKINNYLNYPKEYLIEVKFGIATETDDMEGKIIKQLPVPENLEEKIKSIIPSFIGEISQVPPKFSAIKQNGEKLYELAREGVDFEVKPKKVNIHCIEIKKVNLDSVVLLVTCSSGTYMRSLARDIGEKIGTLGVLSDLTRTSIGNFRLENSFKLEELNSIKDKLISIKDALYTLSEIKLNKEQSQIIKNGNPLTLENCFERGIVKVTFNDEVIAIASVWGGIVKVKRGI